MCVCVCVRTCAQVSVCVCVSVCALFISHPTPSHPNSPNLSHLPIRHLATYNSSSTPPTSPCWSASLGCSRCGTTPTGYGPCCSTQSPQYVGGSTSENQMEWTVPHPTPCSEQSQSQLAGVWMVQRVTYIAILDWCVRSESPILSFTAILSHILGCSHGRTNPISNWFETSLVQSYWNHFSINQFRTNSPHDVSWNWFGT